MTDIIKVLDNHIALAETLGLVIDYIAMPTKTIENLATEILSMLPSDGEGTEFGLIKTYRGVPIRAVESGNVKICYELNGVFCV